MSSAGAQRDAAQITAIHGLKARYCRLLDTKDWDGWRAVFTDDFVSDTRPSGGPLLESGDSFVAFVRRTLADRITVHQMQQPEIELTSATTATGIWAMQDLVRFVPGLTMQGFGHYRENYELIDGEWRIASSTLTRLREELRTPFFSIVVGKRLRALMVRAGSRATR